jgi:hypothetical protein
MKMSRRERRAEAKRYGIPFEPQYNGPVYTYMEYHGVGYERFDNKYITVSTKTTNTEGE